MREVVSERDSRGDRDDVGELEDTKDGVAAPDGDNDAVGDPLSEARALGLESDDGDDTVDALAGELPLASGVAVLHCDEDPDTLGEGVGLKLSRGEPDDDTHPEDDVVAKELGELLSLRRTDREGGSVPLPVTLVVAVTPSDPERDADAH